MTGDEDEVEGGGVELQGMPMRGDMSGAIAVAELLDQARALGQQLMREGAGDGELEVMAIACDV